jgi:hypothetical protein
MSDVKEPAESNRNQERVDFYRGAAVEQIQQLADCLEQSKQLDVDLCLDLMARVASAQASLRLILLALLSEQNAAPLDSSGVELPGIVGNPALIQ